MAVNAYTKARREARSRGEWRGDVPADRARQHLAEIGTPCVVARVSGIPRVVLERIRDGQAQIRKATEDVLLSITKEDVERLYPRLEPQALVPARKAHLLMSDLLLSGYTPAELGRRLGLSGSLSLGKTQMRAWNIKRIEKLYRQTGTKAA